MEDVSLRYPVPGTPSGLKRELSRRSDEPLSLRGGRRCYGQSLQGRLSLPHKDFAELSTCNYIKLPLSCSSSNLPSR